MNKEDCPLCGTEADTQWDIREGHATSLFVDCPVCGWFTIQSSLRSRIVDRNEFKSKLYLLSALSRRNYERQLPRPINTGIVPFVLDSETIERHLETLALADDPLDRVDRLLQLVRERTSSFDSGGEVDPDRDYPLLFVRSRKEYDYIRRVAQQVGYVESPSLTQNVLTPAGWERIRQLHLSIVRTKQVFVAMWFNQETDDAWSEGFKPALGTDLGYDPIRIDQREHINKIDDEIVSAIRTSAFLVADFTGDRGGVYFEAGLAMGLGKPVVWCCRDDRWARKLHFDTRQYSHIMWKDPTDLRTRLAARITAVVRPMLM